LIFKFLDSNLEDLSTTRKLRGHLHPPPRLLYPALTPGKNPGIH
jgi:hypothetical protein